MFVFAASVAYTYDNLGRILEAAYDDGSTITYTYDADGNRITQNVTISNTAPYAPSNPSPAQGATGVTINSTLSWTGGDPDLGDTVTYNVYFGTSNSPALVSSNQSGTSYTPGNLIAESTYYWKVVATDQHGTQTQGPIWSFTTTANNRAPNTPSNPSPAEGATGVATAVTLSWTGGDPDSGDTASYDVYFGTTNPPTTKVASGQSGTSFNPGTLSTGTPYFWRVVATDQHSAQTQGSVWSFTTIPVNRAPNTPTSPSPANGSTGVSLIVALSWTGGDPDSNDTVTYNVYFGTSNSPNLVSSNQSGTSYTPGNLIAGSTYYWKVVATDQHGAQTQGPLWSLTTTESNHAPNIPFSPSPAGGATDVATAVTLSWIGGDPDSGDTVGYDVYLGIMNPPTVKVASGQSGTTYNPGTLNSGTQYFWKVVATDQHGAQTEGPVWGFATITSNHAPNTPSNPSPTDGNTGVPLSATLSWIGGDPDSGDTVGYDVYFGTVNPPASKVSSGQSGTTFNTGILNAGTSYYWKVIATDKHGAQTPGPVWGFTTVPSNHAPNTPFNPSPNAGSTGVPLSTTLSWTGGDPDSGDTVTYGVYFGTSSSPSLVAPNQTKASYAPGVLVAGATYYWKILATDQHGAQKEGPLWKFTTEVSAGTKVIRSTLGAGKTNLDLDMFEFKGTKGERLSITLDADLSASHSGRNAALTLAGPGMFKRSSTGGLPQKITVTLSRSGKYIISIGNVMVAKPRFVGGYSLTMEASAGAQSTLQKFSSVE